MRGGGMPRLGHAVRSGSQGVPAMMSALLPAAAGLASYGDQT
jgi:hypothetical protein